MSNCGNCNDDEIIVLPAGKQGVQGIQGVAGNNGADGTNGATWFSGVSDPLDSLGDDGDFYLNSTTGGIFTKTAGTWGTAILTVTGIAGVAGADGLSFISGVGIPSAGIGNNGDTYVNLSSPLLDLYTKSGGAWSDSGLDLKGATGAAGTNGTNGTNGVDGSKLIQGTGVPASGLGNDDDSYIDNATNDLYLKSSGAWVLTGNVASGSIPAGQEHLFNASSVTEQIVFGDSTSGTNVAVLEFSDDVNAPHFDYGSNWITNTWVSPGTLSDVTFGTVVDVEVVVANTSGSGDVSVIMKKNGVAFNTETISFSGALVGHVENYSGVSSVQSFVAGDLVTCELVSLDTVGNALVVKSQVDGLFFNVQN